MQQPHKNLFFYYRGSRPKSELSELAFERQLEDNATKALLYVLERASRTQVLARFLKTVVGLSSKVRLEEVQFALQRVDIARPEIRRQIALAIAPLAELTPAKSGDSGSGRPDAWIWSENSFAVLLETKIDGPVSLSQLRRHIDSAEGWHQSDVRVKTCTWSDLYGLFQSIRRSSASRDPVTRLLLDEMVRYMTMTGLARTTTFDLDDFGYFLLPAKERHHVQRTLLKRKLLRFAEELSGSKAVQRVVRHYAGKVNRPSDFVHPGAFRKTSNSFWITVGLKERRNRCHLNIRLGESGISLEVFSPHKSFTRRLVKKIEDRPAEFVNSLRPMKQTDPYVFRLREAYYANPDSPYKGQRIGDVVDFLEIHPRVITLDNLRGLIVAPLRDRMRRRELRPEIFLVRNFRLSELVGNSDVVEMVASAAGPMLDYLDFALELGI